MFCKKCGEKMEAGKKFCAKCGTVMEVAEKQENAVGASPSSSSPMKFSNTHIGMAVCGGIGVIALIIVLIVVFSGGGPERTIRRYVSDIGSLDFYRIIDRHYAFNINDVLTQLLSENDMSLSEFNAELYDLTSMWFDSGVRNIRDLYREIANEESADVSEMYGRNIRFSHEIISYRQLSPSDRLREINNVRDALRNVNVNMDDIIRTDRMHEMFTYTISITMTGSLGSETWRETLLLIRIGRNWYIWDNPLDEFRDAGLLRLIPIRR